MDTANQQIEQQMTVLLRRVQRIHLSTTSGEVNLERSAYGIMCKLADEGPQRLGALASTFGLDPSTITRQVQALEEIGLADRKTDPSDRRAAILDLSDTGREVLEHTRAHRRARLRQALSDWSEGDLTEFARLLQEFNVSLDRLLENSAASRGTASVGGGPST
jgi:DNA-binding MarR family transcriptional regulator